MDGNTAALNAYQREQDTLDDQDNALLAAQQELSNDLFDGYFEGNGACVDSVEDFLFDNIDVMNNLLKKMRESFMGRPADPRIAYKSAIGEVCDTLAAQQKTHEDIDNERHECGL